MPVSEKQRFIIQRKLGLKDAIPGSGKWEIITEENKECYICDHQIFTIFFWSPTIG